MRRIGIASVAMQSMNKVWRQTRLQLQTKLRLYQTCIVYTVYFVVWFGDVDTSAGGSTEAGGLSHALPTYDPRDTLA